MSMEPGKRLGPYEIVGPLGAGGMGEVWRAVDTRLDRSVAIKVLPDSLAHDAQLRLRFEREARTISSLNHPNICTLYDVGRDDDSEFLVMELLEGETLADRLVSGPLPLTDVLRYGAEIASALDRAHRAGVIHRDLKPANVMLTRSGAKLLDFGLAKSGSVMVPADDATQHKPLTREGTIVGTFQYMAPEQLEGSEAGARTDIFALGALLYEMATGKRAFAGSSRTSLIAAIVSSQPPPISSLAPMSPAALDHLVRKCLEKDPDDRWQSAHDVATQLRWLGEAGSQAGVAVAVTQRHRMRVRVTWLVAAVALVAAAFVGLGWQKLSGRNSELNALAIVLPAEIRLNTRGGGLALSPDGRWLVVVAAARGEADQLWLRSMSEAELRPLPGTEGAMMPFWSPDGQSIAFFAQLRLRRIDLSGGVVETICEAGSEPRGGSWGRDGTIVFTPSFLEGLYTVPAHGGTPRRITELDRGRGEKSHRWPLFIDGGRQLLFLAQTGEGGVPGDTSTIELLTLKSGARQALVTANSSPLYSADGYLLYWREGSLIARRFDRRRRVGTESFRVAEQVAYDENEYAYASNAGDGALAVVSQDGSRRANELVWIDGSAPHATAAPPGEYDAVAISPDGSRVAYSSNNAVRVRDLIRGTDSRISTQGFDSFNPIWSRDGRWIYWTSTEGVEFAVNRRAASGLGASERVAVFPHEISISDSTSDGSMLLVGSNIYGSGRLRAKTVRSMDLLLLEVASGSLTPLIAGPAAEVEGRFSPDEEWIAYYSDETGRGEIFVRSAKGEAARWQISVEGGWGPRWSSDGLKILYINLDGQLMSVDLRPDGTTLHPQLPARLLGERDDEVITFDVAADGRLLVGFDAVASGFERVELIQNWTRMTKRRKSGK
jgi:eukaryotic-like serine/threonine-protein kinase